jgi:hypothetical protein
MFHQYCFLFLLPLDFLDFWLPSWLAVWFLLLDVLPTSCNRLCHCCHPRRLKICTVWFWFVYLIQPKKNGNFVEKYKRSVIILQHLKLKLISTDSQSASLSWCQAPIWDPWPIIFSAWNFLRQLRLWYFVAPSLTRGQVCNLLYNCFWALPEQSLLGPSPAELMTLFYCLIWDSPNLDGQVPVFISPRNRVAQLYPWALGSLFVASYNSQGLQWRYSNPPPQGNTESRRENNLKTCLEISKQLKVAL